MDLEYNIQCCTKICITISLSILANFRCLPLHKIYIFIKLLDYENGEENGSKWEGNDPICKININ